MNWIYFINVVYFYKHITSKNQRMEEYLFLFELNNSAMIIVTSCEYHDVQRRKEYLDPLVEKYFNQTPEVQAVKVSAPQLHEKLDQLQDKRGQNISGKFSCLIRDVVKTEEQVALLNQRPMPYENKRNLL